MLLIDLVEDKYGRSSVPLKRKAGLHLEKDEYNASASSSDEEEDDDGILASEALDAQIQATLEAIRHKDPRVYDGRAVFYAEPDEVAQSSAGKNTKQGKPMSLSDYHRRNLLEGPSATDGSDDAPTTYAQLQTDLKSVLVREMHAAVNGDNSAQDDRSGDDENDGFLVRKPVKDNALSKEMHKKPQGLNVEAADKDPEMFLSNFLTSRAWVPSESSRFQPFESDDEEEERRADLFEEAYNLRFEDPSASNEKILSHARDAAAKYSVRQESTNPRKKARDAERVKKDEARQAREEEKARLRKLKVLEAEEKIRKIKEAAGLRGKSLQEHDWALFLDEGWDDARWGEEMRKRFGDDYYADQDSDHSNQGPSRGKRKLKKPKWEDDIDIGDLVPDFNAGETGTPQIELTDDDSEGGAPIEGSQVSDHDDARTTGNSGPADKSSKQRERDEQKKSARQERRKIEQLVDQQMEVDEKLTNFGKKHAGYFRYRETSPTAYGLTAQDILMASDSQLNQYAGLKKMAAFRDSDKKKKDKKRLGKKARLRQWRKETFGSEQGPQKTLAEVLAGQDVAGDKADTKESNGVDIRNSKKRKRSRKGKAPNPA
jgi:protein KRI1